MSLRPREIVFEESWYKLVDIIRGVITLNRLRKIDKPLWHNTFSDVYMLCVAHPEPHSKPLYEETRKLLESHVMLIYKVFIKAHVTSGHALFPQWILLSFFLFLLHLSRLLWRTVTKSCSTCTISIGLSSPKDPNI
jgi:hypothetical protein